MVIWMAEAKKEEQSGRPSERTAGTLPIAGAHILNAKSYETLAAQFALVGRELRTIVKEGRTYFEVHRWDECFTCSTEADVRGLLQQFRGAA